MCRYNDPPRRQLRGIGQQRGTEQPGAHLLELIVEADKEREKPQPTRAIRASSQAWAACGGSVALQTEWQFWKLSHLPSDLVPAPLTKLSASKLLIAALFIIANIENNFNATGEWLNTLQHTSTQRSSMQLYKWIRKISRNWYGVICKLYYEAGKKKHRGVFIECYFSRPQDKKPYSRISKGGLHPIMSLFNVIELCNSLVCFHSLK